MVQVVLHLAEQLSRPARGAWIETDVYTSETADIPVAPRTGRVD